MGQVDDLRNAMRLFKRGDVGCGPMYNIEKDKVTIADAGKDSSEIYEQSQAEKEYSTIESQDEKGRIQPSPIVDKPVKPLDRSKSQRITRKSKTRGSNSPLNLSKSLIFFTARKIPSISNCGDSMINNHSCTKS